MWRPTRRVAAQKPDDAIVAVSMQTPSAATELRLPTGAADLHPTAAPRDNAPTEAIPSAPAPIEVPDPLVHPLPVMVGHHQGHMPPIAAGLDVPREMNKQPLPRYVIEPPDILLVESTVFLKADQPIRGQHLVRPDGTIGLGIYGDVFVAGMTLERAREAVFQYLKADRLPGLKSVNQISVDVLAYNSKWYYVITDGGGYGEQVVRLPITGNETVLDAISQINGLAPVSDKKRIWVARRNPGHGAEQVMPVDWIGISQHGTTSTNYQLLPGDRLYVKADKWRTFDSRLQKVLAPIERVLGVTLLGSETVSSVRGRGVGATR
jgi:polysaccharide export outer membrane protein